MSTSLSRARRSRPKSLLALLTSVLVVLSGLLVVPAASAAEAPTVSAEITAATSEGLGVNLSFAGVTEYPDGKMGVYAALVEAGTTNAIGEGTFTISYAVRDGAGTASYTVEPGDLTKGASYEALLWYAHGNPTDDMILARSEAVAITADQWAALFPGTTETPAPGDEGDSGSAGDTGGNGTETGDGGESSDDTGTGDTNGGGDGTTDPESNDPESDDSESGEAEDAVIEEASPITNTDDAAFIWAFKDSWNTYLNGTWTQGKTIVSDGAVRGEGGVIGFAAGVGKTAGTGDAAGDYDATTGLGTIQYEGAVRYTSALHGFDIAMADPWVTFDADGARITAEVSDDDLAGTDSMTRITVAELEGVTSSDADGVRSWTDIATTLADPLQPGGWERYASQDGAPVSFSVQLASAWVPAIEVYEADGVTRLDDATPVYDGDTIVVKGTGFDPEANIGGRGVPIPNTLPQGSYVVFGNFAETWRPSEGVDASARAGGPQAWVLSADVLDEVPANFQGMIRKDWAELSADGSFEATLKLAPLTNRDGSPAALPEGGSYGIYTYAAGGVNNADQELSFALNYQGEKTPGEGEPGESEPGEGEPGDTEPGDTDETAEGSLQWSFKSSWNIYFDYIALGKRAVSGGATLGEGGSASFIPAPGSTYDAATGLGTVKYAGMLVYSSDLHGFEIAVSDPWVEFTKTGARLTANVSTGDTDGASSMQRIPVATLANAKPATVDGVVRWDAVPGVFHEQLQPESWERYAGESIDPLTFSFDPEATPKAPAPTDPVAPKPKPEPKPKPTPARPAPSAQASGSLTWGVSTDFANYVRGDIARGGITTNGVGGGAGAYVFPQATGGSWDADTRTGTVRYSGVVTFTGHHGQLNESASNPVITVHNGSRATLSTAGRTFGLNLAAATKTVGASGEVTWSGVPVTGGFSFGSHALAADGLSFTVGTPSTATHGSSSVGTPLETREIPDTPPAVTGVTVLTDAEKIRPGATIEIEASGFQPNEWGIMAVLYSEPTVLDTEASADEHGVVRWIGTLPDDLEPGTHTITLQGSVMAGAELEVLDTAAEARTLEVMSAEALEQDAEPVAAGMFDTPADGFGGPVLWIGAGVLALLAAGAVGLVVASRRRATTV